MKHIITAFFAITVAGSAFSATETETLLICDGQLRTVIAEMNGKDGRVFTITKVGEKIIKVSSKIMNYTSEYTLNKVDVSVPGDKGPSYRQLIVENDKLILRTEITVDNRTSDFLLYNTGEYEVAGLGMSAKGLCSVSKKAF